MAHNILSKLLLLLQYIIILKTAHKKGIWLFPQLEEQVTYSSLTCQLTRVDKFSTVILHGVLTGGPYLVRQQI